MDLLFWVPELRQRMLDMSHAKSTQLAKSGSSACDQYRKCVWRGPFDSDTCQAAIGILLAC